MRGRRDGAVPPRLARAAKRFAEWRRGRALGTRIPESLWALAVELAASHGVCQTAATLRLDYYGLKERVAAKALTSGPRRVSGPLPAFVELAASSLVAPAECTIEFENAAGSMRVHLKGGHVPDLLALSDSFWKTPR